MIKMTHERDFGDGVTRVRDVFVVVVGSDMQISPQQNRIILREHDPRKTCRYRVEHSMAVFKPYDKPLTPRRPRRDIYV